MDGELCGHERVGYGGQFPRHRSWDHQGTGEKRQTTREKRDIETGGEMAALQGLCRPLPLEPINNKKNHDYSYI